MKKERRKNLTQLAAWTWSWVATLAIATFGPKFIWDDHILLTVLAVTVNFTNGILMIIANRKFFNNLDELERKIHLESLALTLGLAVVVGLTYSLLDVTDLITFDAEISNLVMFIGLAYGIILTVNTRRYS
ncbi:hypothetical protein SAMN06296241_2612 [Salinimicrobium sediminis]|uniref:Uncharacterized protein n=1 Tax=Salinimicrobium sediminis TaxID=1343891 RepID=A0A285X6T7_9FLAO|nr:hypothetical protein [Salinimicrobium sediminis]SOC81040.1 hypothetical protein SAMN06296241_2612 [Salinimicrobium sediminis]